MSTVLLWLGVALLLVWLVVSLTMKVAGFIIHVALLAGVALVAWALARRAWRRRGTPAP